ncbi:L,D-transpeptidase [Aestuariivirga sp.]|uniref:L,D-transpeptidase n=1 Tax=Aestuariivirga sp. TaxID=2650926 RepID=UPI00391B650C
MGLNVSRRGLIGGLAVLCASGAEALADEGAVQGIRPASFVADEQYFDPALLPPPEAETDFPVTPIDPSSIPERFRPQLVDFDGPEDCGSLVVDPGERLLYQVLFRGQARRYGVGVGRAGFAWSGSAKIGMKRRWPRWVPPREMVDRDQNARKWVNGQPGGPTNPLGSRALYLFAGGKDTLYRIHGTNEPHTIGKAVSSGCIRMLNQDVAELFENVNVDTPVTVRAATG